MAYSQCIGIDVSKDVLDFGCYVPDQKQYLQRVDNQITDITTYMEALQQNYDFETTLFCLETTGVYTQPFLTVSLQMGAKVWLQNALEISRSLGIKRGRNDVIDSQDIAQYGFRWQDKAQLYQAPEHLNDQIQALLRVRANLLETLKRLQTPVKEIGEFATTVVAEIWQKSTQNTISAVKDDLKNIEKQLNDLLAQDTSLEKNFEIITSVTGVGKWTAWQILMTTQNFTKFNDPKQYASYCGVAPFSKSSGRWKGKNKLSKIANKTMKSLLHMCALSAIKYDEDLKAFYERKVQEGKSKMSVLNAIRNKIILRIFACIKKQQNYEKIMTKNLQSS